MVDLKQLIKTNNDLSLAFSELFELNYIEPNEQELVFLVLNDFLNGKMIQEEIPIELRDRANIDLATAMDVAFDFTDDILPLLPESAKASISKEEFLPEIKAKIRLADIFAEIIKASNVQIKEDLKKRFENIVLNWYRDIRDDAETLEILNRSSKVGGMELTEFQGQNILKAMKQIEADYAAKGIKLLELITEQLTAEKEVFQKKTVEETNIDVTAKLPKQAGITEKIMANDLTIEQMLKPKSAPLKASAGSLAEKIEAKEAFLEEHEEIAPPSPAKVVPPIVAPAPKPVVPPPAPRPVAPSMPKPIMPAPKPAAPVPPIPKPFMPAPPIPAPAKKLDVPAGPPQSAPLVQPQPSAKIPINQPTIKKLEPQPGQRPQMHDVKFMGQLYGPIDELGSISIDDMRRLSKDPLEAVDKIRGKLDLLEDESITKKVEGIKALKNSPLYKLYADIMNEAIKQGKSIQDIAQTYKVSTDEFRAIMELNKSLKY